MRRRTTMPKKSSGSRATSRMPRKSGSSRPMLTSMKAARRASGSLGAMSRKEVSMLGKARPKKAKNLLGAFAEEVKKDNKLRKSRNSGRGQAGRTRRRYTRSLNKATQSKGK